MVVADYWVVMVGYWMVMGGYWTAMAGYGWLLVITERMRVIPAFSTNGLETTYKTSGHFYKFTNLQKKYKF